MKTRLDIIIPNIRKSAHLIEYALLAFFASRAFGGASIRFLERFWHVLAMAVVLITASLDEINQSFDPTRTGSIYDVILDCLGGFAMICILVAYKRLRNN